MSRRATGCEYVYAELQVVAECDDPADHRMLGHTVVAVRLQDSPDAPSRVLAFGVEQARRLRDDLDRVLREYDDD